MIDKLPPHFPTTFRVVFVSIIALLLFFVLWGPLLPASSETNPLAGITPTHSIATPTVDRTTPITTVIEATSIARATADAAEEASIATTATAQGLVTSQAKETSIVSTATAEAKKAATKEAVSATQTEEALAVVQTQEAMVVTQTTEAIIAVTQTAEANATKTVESVAATQTAEFRATQTAIAITAIQTPSTITNELLPAVTLTRPLSGTDFVGKSKEIILEWEWSGILEENQYYFVSARFTGLDENQQCRENWLYFKWTKDTRFVIDPWLYDVMCSTDRQIRWTVYVGIPTDLNNLENRNGIILSDEIPSRSFLWIIPPSGSSGDNPFTNRGGGGIVDPG